MVKDCKRCGETKPAEQFYARPRNRLGLSTNCKPCERVVSNIRLRERRSDPEVRARQNELARARGPRPPEQTRRQRLWTWHRLTVEQFDERLAAQGGACGNPGCDATEPGGKGAWHVDHDHACCPGPRSCGGCVRGLLCNKCNVALGYARDSAAVLRGLADYLDFNAALSALGPIGG